MDTTFLPTDTPGMSRFPLAQRSMTAGILTVVLLAAPPRLSLGARLAPSALEYVGAFRLPPDAGEPPATWDWGGQAMTYVPGGDPDGPADGFPGSLLVTGFDGECLVAEITIPAPTMDRDPAILPAAAFLQPFSDVRGGLFPTFTELPRAGIEWLPAQPGEAGPHIWLTWGQHYQEPGPEVAPTHARCDLDLGNPRTEGAWWVGTASENEAGLIYAVNDYLFAIPTSWAAAHTGGRALATGRFRDGGWSGMGPELVAIGPWLEGDPPPPETELPYTPLIRYSVANRGPHRLDGYSAADEWSGGAWIESGSGSAVVFAGTRGSGYTWYGFQTPADVPPAPGWPEGAPCVYTVGDVMCVRPDGETPCTEEDMAPCRDADVEEESRGWWASSFDAVLLLYDPEELAAVAEGREEPWKPQPYAVLDVDRTLLGRPLSEDAAVYLGRGNQRHTRLGAAAFDRERGILWILEPFGNGAAPVVHAWRIRRRSARRPAGRTGRTVRVVAATGSASD